MPTSKTVHSDGQYLLYLSYVLQHLQAFHGFYDFNSAKFNFNNYQGRLRANEEMANMLIDGGKKFNIRKRKKTNKNKRRKRKRRKGQKTVEARNKAENANRWTAAAFSEDRTKFPLIVFGDGMRNKDNVHFKGHSSGVTGKLYRTLLRRQRYFLAAVVDINEFKTSKVCNNCNGVEMKEVRISDGSSVYGTKICKTCGIIWQETSMRPKICLLLQIPYGTTMAAPTFSRHRHKENGAAGSIPTA
ncbi:hypothetical protein BDF20DRAFT_916276 [Mycotypha africana]|uniref:uncharacterized protein n=1 Tax=Mycotypha africana TaxID=64632 RepID=UPI0023014EF5|nr:uncharacterized protein BDF20DRAFT_916276 [Mycotypha africana]KAI8970480.1 hypothetical protein BDF20DRAFT_916276 [Mycotypha africana]